MSSGSEPGSSGTAVMTLKADFNAEEWQHVIEGPLSAGLLVAAADRGGTLRESVSLARLYAHARRQSGG
jgi:hypothetical protein